jgi:hypothetical protein
MSDQPDDALSGFLDFINQQLDMTGLTTRLTDAEIERSVMPLIRGDIYRETLSVVDALMNSPQRDHWRARLAPFHREIRQCLAQTVATMMAERYPDRMSHDEWLDVATLIITVAWLVRKHMDGDDHFPADN